MNALLPFKSICLSILFSGAALFATPAFAGRDGGGGTGGGDPCENRIKQIRENLIGWIKDGGPRFLKFKSADLDATKYSKQMLSFLESEVELEGQPGSKVSKVAFECVNSPLYVDGFEKVCRWDYKPQENMHKFQCYRDGFMNEKITSPVEQFRNIHHEYAGFANVEPANYYEGSYDYSNQLSEYGHFERVYRLRAGPPVITDRQTIFEATKLSDIAAGSILDIKQDIFIPARTWQFFVGPKANYLDNTANCELQISSSYEDRFFKAGKYKILDRKIYYGLPMNRFFMQKGTNKQVSSHFWTDIYTDLIISSLSDSNKPNPHVSAVRCAEGLIQRYDPSVKMDVVGDDYIYQDAEIKKFNDYMKDFAEFIPSQPKMLD